MPFITYLSLIKWCAYLFHSIHRHIIFSNVAWRFLHASYWILGRSCPLTTNHQGFKNKISNIHLWQATQPSYLLSYNKEMLRHMLTMISAIIFTNVHKFSAQPPSNANATNATTENNSRNNEAIFLAFHSSFIWFKIALCVFYFEQIMFNGEVE